MRPSTKRLFGLISCLIFLLVSSSGYTETIWPKVPDVPASERDDEVVEVSLRTLRVANWYGEQYPIIRQQLIDTQQIIRDEEHRVIGYQISLGIVSVLLVGVLIAGGRK